MRVTWWSAFLNLYFFTGARECHDRATVLSRPNIGRGQTQWTIILMIMTVSVEHSIRSNAPFISYGKVAL